MSSRLASSSCSSRAISGTDSRYHRMGPVVMAFEVEGSRERRIVIGYKKGGTTSFFSALSNLYHA